MIKMAVGSKACIDTRRQSNGSRFGIGSATNSTPRPNDAKVRPCRVPSLAFSSAPCRWFPADPLPELRRIPRASLPHLQRPPPPRLSLHQLPSPYQLPTRNQPPPPHRRTRPIRRVGTVPEFPGIVARIKAELVFGGKGR